MAAYMIVGDRLDRVRRLLRRLGPSHPRFRAALEVERDRLEAEFDRYVRQEIVRRLIANPVVHSPG